LPPVQALYRQFRDRGFEVVLVSFQESTDLVKRTVRERGYITPVLLDQNSDVAGRRYGVFGPPTMYLIDRQGRLLARGVGPHDWAAPAARALIADLLGPAPPGR
jgi:peroxiredoxin